MKRLVPIALAFALLTGCGSDSSENADPSTASGKAKSDTPLSQVAEICGVDSGRLLVALAHVRFYEEFNPNGELTARAMRRGDRLMLRGAQVDPTETCGWVQKSLRSLRRWEKSVGV